NGVEPALFAPHEDGIEPQSCLRVLYAGTLGRSQNLSNAVEAAQLAHESGVNISLRLIGSGAEEQDLARLAKASSLDIQVLSPLDLEEVLEQYAWADTTLVTLTGWQPFLWTVPSKLYEIMAVGKHVCATVEGETAALVEELGDGHVVPPDNAEELVSWWRPLANNPELLTVSHEAHQWVTNNLNFDVLGRQYLELLNDVQRKRQEVS